MSSPAGNLEKRYLINFRQVGVIALQSRRVDGQVFEAGNLIFTPNIAAIKRCHFQVLSN